MGGTVAAGSEIAPQVHALVEPRDAFLGRDGGGQALPALEAEAAATAARAAGAAEVAIAGGDHAYNLCDNAGARGAAFMERFSNISSYLPVWTILGNHELPSDCKVDFNASHYVNMLGRNMPGDTNGSYYSVNVGQTHIVFLSSEVIALGPYGGVTVAAQSAWLRKDLAAVDRAATPWVLAVIHRPLQCSNANSWCGARAGRNNPVRLELEPIFLAGGVDVILAGHEHSVEFTWPVKNGAATAFNYNSPTAPVYVIAGAAGCNENKGECLNPMGKAAGNWSRVRLAGDPQQVRNEASTRLQSLPSPRLDCRRPADGWRARRRPSCCAAGCPARAQDTCVPPSHGARARLASPLRRSMATRASGRSTPRTGTWSRCRRPFPAALSCGYAVDIYEPAHGAFA